MHLSTSGSRNALSVDIVYKSSARNAIPHLYATQAQFATKASSTETQGIHQRTDIEKVLAYAIETLLQAPG